MTTEIARFMRTLEGVWDGHLDALLEHRDVDAALRGMTAEPSVRHMPTQTGAEGRAALERYYRETLLPHLPSELQLTRRSRTVDRFRLVDELTVSFLHDCELTWLTPGVAAGRPGAGAARRRRRGRRPAGARPCRRSSSSISGVTPSPRTGPCGTWRRSRRSSACGWLCNKIFEACPNRVGCCDVSMSSHTWAGLTP